MAKHHPKKHQPGVVARVWDACTSSWPRVIATVAIVFILVSSGLVAAILNWILVEFLIPLGIIAFIFGWVKSYDRRGRSPH
jgi:hypothetical protein